MRAPPLRILLVDDNRHGLIARRAVLRQHGYEVTIAAGGQEGIDRLAEENFDLVVTKYVMPGASGQQVIRKIRQQNPQVPIVVLSGYVESLGLTEASTGADAVLSKGPREVQELLRTIVRLARKRPAARPAAKATAAAAGAGRAGRRKTG